MVLVACWHWLRHIAVIALSFATLSDGRLAERVAPPNASPLLAGSEASPTHMLWRAAHLAKRVERAKAVPTVMPALHAESKPAAANYEATALAEPAPTATTARQSQMEAAAASAPELAKAPPIAAPVPHARAEPAVASGTASGNDKVPVLAKSVPTVTPSGHAHAEPAAANVREPALAKAAPTAELAKHAQPEPAAATGRVPSISKAVSTAASARYAQAETATADASVPALVKAAPTAAPVPHARAEPAVASGTASGKGKEPVLAKSVPTVTPSQHAHAEPAAANVKVRWERPGSGLVNVTVPALAKAAPKAELAKRAQPGPAAATGSAPALAKAAPTATLVRHAHAAPASAPSAAPGQARLEQDVEIRPNDGKGADIVEFGIYLKKILGIDPKEGSYTADIVLTMRWKDARVKSLMHSGAQSHTLRAHDSTIKKIWMPDITVTNREIKGQEIISTAIQLLASGQVIKTQRMIVVCTNGFNLAAFPFDVQVLRVRVASATLMYEDLQLVPLQDKEENGAKDGLLDGTDLWITDVTPSVYEEVDGSLHKSRGMLEVGVKRKWWKYMRTALLPRFFLIAIAWTVFYIPLMPHFAMPRVATSLISFLALMMFATSTIGAGGQTWLDVFEDSCCTLVLFAAFSNNFVEIIFHTLNLPHIAGRMDYELKFFWPLVASVVFAVLFATPFIFKQINVTYLSLLTRFIVVVCPLGYLITATFVRFPELSKGLKNMHNKYTS